MTHAKANAARLLLLAWMLAPAASALAADSVDGAAMGGPDAAAAGQTAPEQTIREATPADLPASAPTFESVEPSPMAPAPPPDLSPARLALRKMTLLIDPTPDRALAESLEASALPSFGALVSEAGAAPAAAAGAAASTDTLGLELAAAEAPSTDSLAIEIPAFEMLGGAFSVARAETELLREQIGVSAQPKVLQSLGDLEQMLGANPRWIWRLDEEMGRPDPMLIPWVAAQLIYENQHRRAVAYEKAKRYEEAKTIYKEVLPLLEDPKYIQLAEGRIAEIDGKIEEEKRMAEIARNAASTRQTGPAPVKIVEPTLPMYIERETRGILFDQSDPRRSVVLIGGDNFMVGEIIEGYENVWIKDVRLDSRPDPMAADQSVKVYTVVYSVTNEFNLTKDFEVRISGNATDSKMELGGMRERRFKQ